MSGHREHSVKVPRFYKAVANILRSVREDGSSLKSLVYGVRGYGSSRLYALASSTLQKLPELEQIFTTTKLLINEPRLDPWLAKVLVNELLWGKQTLPAVSKPVETVLAYEKQLREASETIDVKIKKPIRKIVSKPRYVRVNTLSLTVEDAISQFESESWKLLPKCSDYSSYLKVLPTLAGTDTFIQDFHVAEVFAFPPETTFHGHPLYEQGKILLQDKVSCLPAFLLNPPPGSVVLDMCAAPGMKTSHLAAILKNQGKIYAVEKSANRYEVLYEQLRLTNAHCVEPLHSDAFDLDGRRYLDVEYILVDPSCSGSGMINRSLVEQDPDEIDEDRLKRLHSMQVFLLRHALVNFRNVKRVVYSTCSLHSEENEAVVDEVFKKVGKSYTLLSLKQVFGTNWLNFSSTDYGTLDRCIYARPEVDFCNGFFVAVFERNFDAPLPKRPCDRELPVDRNIFLGANAELKEKQNVQNEDKPPEKEEKTQGNVSEGKKRPSRKRKKRGKRKPKIKGTDRIEEPLKKKRKENSN